MLGGAWRFMLPATGREGAEQLDRPLTNFDVIGVPTGEWSSGGLLACHRNVVPSCVLAFCCPCLLWAQVVVRAQIPLLIALKNSLVCLRRNSGFGAFFDLFFWSVVLCAGLVLVLALVDIPSRTLFYFLIIVVLIVGGALLYLMGHTRTAFKEKYRLPTILPVSCLAWEMMLDVVVSTFCLPCSLAQMARHVFQYDAMDTDVGLFLGDPAALPPLRPLPLEQLEEGGQGGTRSFERPARADEAGLSWTDNQRHPAIRDQRGAAHRQEEIVERQRQELLSGGAQTDSSSSSASAPPIPVAVAVPINRA